MNEQRDVTALKFRKRIRPIFAWYDFWVGAFYDRDKRRLYIFPIPCIGVVVDL